MLSQAQANEMSVWEATSGKTPTVSLERIRINDGDRESSPFGPSVFPIDFPHKRGPGRPAKARR